jgi:N6-L-threonylcarbamoyladenine synthase
MLNSKNYDFSFSGLKTAVLYLVRDLIKAGLKLEDFRIEVAYEAQEAIIDVLVAKTIKAAKEYKVKSVMLSGGVSANKRLRERLEAEANKLGLPFFKPEMVYTGDNAAMIALAGYFNSKASKQKTDGWKRIKAKANWEIV